MNWSTRFGWALAAAILPGLTAGCADDEVLSPVAPKPPDVCGGYAFKDSASARVFAVQPRVDPENFVSIDAYRGHLKALVDKNIKPCLAPDRPNLIALPEDIGLPAAFLGSRAQKARSADFIAEAFFYLADAYAAPMDHYKSVWPDLALAEALQLGLTDTIWRAFYETMRDIAVETGAHVIASANVSGSIERSEDPAEIAALMDPDSPGAEYVYVARDRAIYNAAFVFSPAGEIVARARKPYLVEAEEKDLLLTEGALREAVPVDLGFARLAVLTSKDAWMPDMVDRLAALGADVIVQPEAFSGWGIEEMPGDWLPDVFIQSGWSAVQKHGSYRYAIIPHLTGNLFDQIFDGQSAIIGDAVPGDVMPAYVGQPPEGGFLTVAPWVAEDNQALSLEERRAILREAGAALAPGGSSENGYLETVVAADINTGVLPGPPAPDGEPGALGKSRILAEAPSGEQVAPAAASDGAMSAVLAWQDDRGGVPQIYIARSTDAGATFGAAAPAAPTPNPQITPAVLLINTSVYVAWQERDPVAGARILVSLSTDSGQAFSAGVPVTPPSPGEPLDEWKPALAADPSGAVFLAFVSGQAGNERVQCARGAAGSNTWQVTAADGDPPAFEGLNIRNNQWAPAVAAQNGEVAVAWTDFRSYNWDIVLARSTDGGQSFSAASRIDDGTDARERIHNDPALLHLGADGLFAAWTDVRMRRPFSKARAARAVPNSIEPSLLLGPAPASAPTSRPRLASTGAGSVVAVWQDFRARSNAIYLAVSADAGASFGPEQRIDDGGPNDQLAPALTALSGGGILVAWEDTRAGARRIRFVTGKP